MNHDDVEKPANISYTLSRVFTPLRIIFVIIILSIVAIKIPWASASMIFYGFFIIFFSSFVIEAIHYGKNRREFVGLTVKYMLILPFEFIGVFVFAITTLPFPDSQKVNELEIKITIMVAGVSMICELYHYITLSKEKFQLDIRRILAIILMAVLIVYEGIFIYLFLLTANSHS